MKTFLALCAFLLLCSCKAPEPGSPADRALSILRGVGDAVLRLDGLAAVRKVAPELEPILNPDKNDVLTLAEVEAAITEIMANPEQSALLFTLAVFLQKR